MVRRLVVVFLLVAWDAAGAGGATLPVEVAPGVHLLRGVLVPGQQPDGNTIVLDAPEGLVVVDTGRHVAHTRAILDYAAERKKPIQAVVNTHWHLDHVGGNLLIRREVPGVKIYATAALEGALKGFLASYANQLKDVIAKSKEGSEEQQRYRTELGLIEAGSQLAPDEVVSSSGRRTIAGRPLVVNVETHAVTAGDLWLYDAATKTLMAGDLVTLPYPFLDTACPDRWQESLGRLSKTGFKILIPGHGPPMSREQFERYRGAYRSLVACGVTSEPDAVCADQWLREAGDLVAASEHDYVKRALGYYLENHLRAAARKRNATLCGESN